jgi:hypothetical protein
MTCCERRLSAVVWLLAVLMLSGDRGGVLARSYQSAARENRVLWRNPAPISARDLSWDGNAARVPPKPPFTFLEEDTSGTRPKVVVRSGDGTIWNVKLGGRPDDEAEVHAEVAAGRLVWALGYFAEETYYVPSGIIEGVGKVRRAARALEPDGRFRSARFEKRPADVVRTGERWSFDRNPFVGTKELSGLMILMTMINNWDLGGTRNMTVLRAPGAEGTPELRYLVADLGATFGRMDGSTLIRRRSKWQLEEFTKQAFIDRATPNALDLHFAGDGAIDVVPMEHARWFAGLVTQLTPDQVYQAFEAAGASPPEADGFSTRLLSKIRDLASVTKISGAPILNLPRQPAQNSRLPDPRAAAASR